MKNLTVGILAHVDAGKTTLSEAMLFACGKIKKAGRVDHRDTYLDNHDLERERGITIFSKQAIMTAGDTVITLLDTPGHVDFSAEAERTLSVIDCAVFVISAPESIQAHTETLWQLLSRYRIPTIVFVTKTDLVCPSRDVLMAELCARLDHGIVNFCADDSERNEKIAMCDEDALDEYMDSGDVSDETVRRLIRKRRLFPCIFGSGLRQDGVDRLISMLCGYAESSVRNDSGEFAARVYKIGHDRNGAKLTYLKVTSGKLNVRQSIKYLFEGADSETEEKITGIRLYSGAKFDTAESVGAGTVCAVTGLSGTYSGQGLGGESEKLLPILEPVMTYRIVLPKDVDPALMLPKLRELEEEEPLLHIVWRERFGEIHAQLMGQVQTEVLTALIKERYGVEVSFDSGSILYKETVSGPVEGVGHFEPLRHYAEVHLLIEPAGRGEGLKFASLCSENALEKNWQRLILTHLEEKQHLGVLTGSPLTDMKITLVAGRAHLKHTEGGDFREATYRAVREGLMFSADKNECVLLEPYYSFTIELPGECVGHAISDIIAASGTYEEQSSSDGISVLTGHAPVSELDGYASSVAAYTHGRGHFSCRVEGYFPCHNTEEVIARYSYDPESDIDNTPDSVFCSHGAGIIVPWRLVPQYMHVEGLKNMRSTGISSAEYNVEAHRTVSIDERELEAIMEREFGPIRRPVYGEVKNGVTVDVSKPTYRKSLYIVDGYNVIFAWDELAAEAENDLEGARKALCEILANYKAFTGKDIILVFDAYKVKGAAERKIDYNGLHIVYTKEGELGDTYIEKLVSRIGHDFSVRVVTSDGLIQLQAIRSGVLRLSAREFREEVTAADEEIKKFLEKMKKKQK